MPGRPLEWSQTLTHCLKQLHALLPCLGRSHAITHCLKQLQALLPCLGRTRALTLYLKLSQTFTPYLLVGRLEALSDGESVMWP